MKRKVTLNAFFFTLFAGVPAIGSSAGGGNVLPPSDDAILIRDDYDFKASEKLSREQVKEDIALLRYALLNGYGGTLYPDQKPLNDAMRKLAALQKKGAGDSSQTLCDKLARILYAVPDKHLSVWHMQTKCGTFPILAQEPAPQAGTNIAKQEQIPWETASRNAGRHKVPVISITSLPGRGEPSWNGFLDAVRDTASTAPAIIFDLRGCGGGDNGMPAKAAGILYGQTFSGAEIDARVMKTPAAKALLANSFKWEMLGNQFSGLPVTEQMKAAYDNAILDYKLAKEGPAAEKPGDGQNRTRPPLDPAKLYKGPLYFLVDRACGSSCESMLEIFKAHPKTRVIGENTSGAIHFCPVNEHLVLPNSQIHVEMSDQYNRYADGRFVEKKGYAPDVRVTGGQDAMAVALELLQKALDRTSPAP